MSSNNQHNETQHKNNNADNDKPTFFQRIYLNGIIKKATKRIEKYNQIKEEKEKEKEKERIQATIIELSKIYELKDDGKELTHADILSMSTDKLINLFKVIINGLKKEIRK